MQLKHRTIASFMARQFMRLAGAAALCSLGIVSASAQVNEKELLEVMMSKVAGTQRVFTQPTMSSGKLSGCSLIFEAMTRDYSYRQGQFIKVDGTIGIVEVSGAFGAILKVVVNEINPPSLTLTPAPPSRAYLIGSKFETNLDSLISADESDTAGALFSVFELSPTVEMLFSALQSKKITVAFNKKGGSSNIPLLLELDVAHTDETGKRTRNDEAAEGFTQCATVLFEHVK